MVQAKFIRAVLVSPAPSNGTKGYSTFLMKLIYEFWGFCVNGSNDLVKPGGFATSQVTGSYISMPSGFESGSAILLASGSDGQTAFGFPYFSASLSSPFTTGSIGKYLVAWQSGSTSTDDSVYLINGYVSPSIIQVDPTTGGTPNTGSNFAPVFTDRASINYRVVDILSASVSAGIVSNQYMVLQLNGAPDVNPGQANSQFRIRAGNGGSGIVSNIAITLSPSGSWDGTQFVGESFAEFGGDGQGDGGTSFGGNDWWFDFGAGIGYISLFGWNNFLIASIGGGAWTVTEWNPNSIAGSTFHVEIPQRLYPQAFDPNPICGMNQAASGVWFDQLNHNYGNRWFPSPNDPTMRQWILMIPCVVGAPWPGTYFGGNSGLTTGVIPRYALNYNQVQNKFLLQDAILSSAPNIIGGPTLTQYCLSRAKLRTAKFTSAAYAIFTRVGDVGTNDQWLMASAKGVWWPWDGATMARRPTWGI